MDLVPSPLLHSTPIDIIYAIIRASDSAQALADWSLVSYDSFKIAGPRLNRTVDIEDERFCSRILERMLFDDKDLNLLPRLHPFLSLKSTTSLNLWVAPPMDELSIILESPRRIMVYRPLLQVTFGWLSRLEGRVDEETRLLLPCFYLPHLVPTLCPGAFVCFGEPGSSPTGSDPPVVRDSTLFMYRAILSLPISSESLEQVSDEIQDVQEHQDDFGRASSSQSQSQVVSRIEELLLSIREMLLIQPDRLEELLAFQERIRPLANEWEGFELRGETAFWDEIGPYPEQEEVGKTTALGLRYEMFNRMSKRENDWNDLVIDFKKFVLSTDAGKEAMRQQTSP